MTSAAPIIEGARCQKVASTIDTTDELRFRLRAPGETLELLVSTEAGAIRWCMTEHRAQAPRSPAAFVMLLRKHVEGALLEHVEMLGGDRVVIMAFRAGPHRRDVVCELFGAVAQIALLDGDGLVLGLHHPRRTSERLSVGEPYSPPPPPNELDGEVTLSAPDPPLEFHYRIDRQIRERLEGERRERIRAKTRQAIRRASKRLERLSKKLDKELERAENADEHKRRGELLQSAYGNVARGARYVNVTDFYDPAQSVVRIELDPKLDLQANIARAFHSYRRLQRAQEHLVDRVLATEEKLEQAAALLERLESAQDIESIERIRALAQKTDLFREKQRQAERSNRRESTRLPYSTYTSRDGRRILVGRGSADNDRLTFQHARGRDLWLHAEDWAGSHVIVPLGKGEQVPRRTLEDAALLAGHFSKGKKDVVVAVRYTLRSNVRKPKGLAPGRVTVADARSIDVRLDSPELESLLRTRGES